MDYQKFHEDIINETNEDILKYGEAMLREDLKFLIIKEDISREDKIRIINEIEDAVITEDHVGEYLTNSLSEGARWTKTIERLKNTDKFISGMGKYTRKAKNAARDLFNKVRGKTVEKAEEILDPVTGKMKKVDIPSRPIVDRVIGYGVATPILYKFFNGGYAAETIQYVSDITFNYSKSYERVLANLNYAWQDLFRTTWIAGQPANLASVVANGTALVALFTLNRAIGIITTTISTQDKELNIARLNAYRENILWGDNELNRVLNEFDNYYNSIIDKTDLNDNDLTILREKLSNVSDVCIPKVMGLSDTSIPSQFSKFYPDYVIGMSLSKDAWVEAGNRVSALIDKGIKELLKRQDMCSVIVGKYEAIVSSKIGGTAPSNYKPPIVLVPGQSPLSPNVKSEVPRRVDPGDVRVGERGWWQWVNDIYYKVTTQFYTIKSMIGTIATGTAGKIFGIGAVLTLVSLAGYYIWKKFFKSKDCAKYTGEERNKCEIEAVDAALKASRKELKKCQYTVNPRKCMEEAKKLVSKWEDRKLQLIKNSSGDVI